MKRTAILAILLLSLCSCAKIIDWVPITFKVRVQDAQGNDLLDPEKDNSWLIGTTISFRGIIVEIDEESIAYPRTKYLPAIYEGLRLEKGSDYYYLAFGEFDGGSNYDNENLYLNWPDGSHNVITYKRKIHQVRVRADEVFKLDGVKCSNPVVIVK
ncbi:MAG: hypothetical protein ACI3ZP_05510 [Candidatus Cryptobacteroides sp.]